MSNSRPDCPPEVLAHDLLRLASVGGVSGDGAPPDWVSVELNAAPWVVVRRAYWRDGRIPVGVRGPERNQRWAGWLRPDAIAERLPPEAGLSRLANLPRDRVTSLPALAALEPLAAILQPYGLPWGATGSVGFELAAGRPTVKPSSDLDALIRSDRPISRPVATSLVQALGALPVRCDLMMETPMGGVVLLEYARVQGPVAVRGRGGPRLVTDPWASPAAGEGDA